MHVPCNCSYSMHDWCGYKILSDSLLCYLFLSRFSSPPPCPVFSFLIALLTNFSSGVSNALKALDRAFLTFCLPGIATSYGGMLLRRLPGPRKRVGERVHTYAHARTKTISRPNWRASVASETLTGVKMKKSGIFVYWRASEASETLSGVWQSRFRYLSVYGVRETSVFARASNYVS